jgi:hypothetical protein
MAAYGSKNTRRCRKKRAGAKIEDNVIRENAIEKGAYHDVGNMSKI